MPAAVLWHGLKKDKNSCSGVTPSLGLEKDEERKSESEGPQAVRAAGARRGEAQAGFAKASRGSASEQGETLTFQVERMAGTRYKEVMHPQCT